MADAVRDQINHRLAHEAGFEDVVQDVMLQVVRDLQRFKVRGEGSLHQWIITLVRNRIRDLYDYYERAVKRHWSRKISLSDLRREEQDGDHPDEMTTGVASLSDAASDRDLMERAVALVRELPPNEQQAVRRIDLEGESIAALARELGLGESTVRMRRASGLTRIAQMIGAEFCERRTGDEKL